MSLVRLLPAWFHAVADYAVGALLVIVALAVGGSAGAVATGVVVGAVVLSLSAVTRYPLGIVRVVPFTVHSAGDYLASGLLIGAPFALNYFHSDTSLAVFYIASGVAVAAVSLITNYQWGPGSARVVDLTDSPVQAGSTTGRGASTSVAQPISANATTTTTPTSTNVRPAARRPRPLVAQREVSRPRPSAK